MAQPILEHKSGYSAKGASSVLFRNQELQEFSRFDFDEWPSGAGTVRRRATKWWRCRHSSAIAV